MGGGTGTDNKNGVKETIHKLVLKTAPLGIGVSLVGGVVLLGWIPGVSAKVGGVVCLLIGIGLVFYMTLESSRSAFDATD